MECKGAMCYYNDVSKRIGIYPEWNVKMLYSTMFNASSIIGIYPEWNVKGFMTDKLDKTMDWNISRMECKALRGNFMKRKTYPLEYIQNGM